MAKNQEKKWQEVKLGDVCDVLNGRAYKQSELLNTGKYPVLRVGNFFSRDKWYYSNLELEESKYCNNGDLLYAWSASFGPKIWNNGKVIYHYHIWKLQPNLAILDKLYLFYWLKESTSLLTQGIHGSVMAHLTKSDMEKMLISLPPLEVQKKIAGLLGALDDKIELNNKINQNLEAQAQALFKSWFIDFEPFGGKMPDDWKEINLSDIAEFIGGYSYKSSELQSSSTVMATIKNFDRQGGFKLDGFKEISPSEKLKENQKISLFDTLVAHTDLTQNADVIGNAEMLLSTAGYSNVIISMDVVKVIPKKGISKFLLATLLKDNRFKQHCLGYINGTYRITP